MKMWEPTECPGTEELKDRLQTAREKLARQQMLLKEKKLPVLVLMEGWGTAGKGNCIGRVIQNIDPLTLLFFHVDLFSIPDLFSLFPNSKNLNGFTQSMI